VRWFFAFFFVSGFCSILYELVWLRLAMAQFAVTTALISIVLSAFMIGLGLGSWGAGTWVRSRRAFLNWPSLQLYAFAEFFIGISALSVPWELGRGRVFLERLNAGHALSPPAYYSLAGLWIGLTLIPWCGCMGATFPFAMAAIRERFPAESPRSFSYLYLANVLGAVTGTWAPLLLIEEFGFHGTLRTGSVLNFCLAATALLLSWGFVTRTPTVTVEPVHDQLAGGGNRWPYYVLFGTGFTSMAAEVAWIRLFTHALGTVVYAFAVILGLYLLATYLGSRFYRRSATRAAPGSSRFGWLGLAVVLPLLISDPRLPIIYKLRVGSILPFSFLMGWITPAVLDRLAQGDPDRAGRGYAVNVAGCVVGPLVAGFFLLPFFGERYTLLICALPWMAISFWGLVARLSFASQPRRSQAVWKPALISVASLLLVGMTEDYESLYTPREVLHDSTATVMAAGALREDKTLLVNGVGMTAMTPITKMIAHLPLAFLSHAPHDALVICFGMGTTHRSMLSWGISSTAVELVPSVVSVFPFFHANAAELLRLPQSHVVIDDGRFFLQRSSQQYDVIVLDPPPPVEAAASSLLYSKEFYAIAREHLRAGGILQQWLPAGSSDPATVASVAKALQQSFPHIRVFHSVERWGYHFLASDIQIPRYSALILAGRLPPAAVADLLEWGPAADAQDQFARVLNQELSLDELIRPDPGVPALQDDRPVNEYFILRRLQKPEYIKQMWRDLLERVRLESQTPQL
jgi:spermidine synthase